MGPSSGRNTKNLGRFGVLCKRFWTSRGHSKKIFLDPLANKQKIKKLAEIGKIANILQFLYKNHRLTFTRHHFYAGTYVLAEKWCGGKVRPPKSESAKFIWILQDFWPRVYTDHHEKSCNSHINLTDLEIFKIRDGYARAQRGPVSFKSTSHMGYYYNFFIINNCDFYIKLTELLTWDLSKFESRN